jgi:hypothetical protein
MPQLAIEAPSTDRSKAQVNGSNKRLPNLDLLRGLAALLVCAGHLRSFLMVDFGEVRSPSILDRAFYFATGLGHQAVVVFFLETVLAKSGRLPGLCGSASINHGGRGSRLVVL